VHAELLLQPQFELPMQLDADVKVEHDEGVPLHVALELHWQFSLAAHVLLEENVLHAVGVPLQVLPPPDQLQLLLEVAHDALSVNSEQGVGVPVQRVSGSQTQPGKRAHVDAPEFASEHRKV